MNDVQETLRSAARKLLEESKADLVIGYGQGSLPYRTRPIFVERAADVERLVWNPFCSYDLVTLLTRPELAGYRTKAVVVKACDALAAACLIQEEQIPRDRVILIGVPCDGVVSREKAGRNPEGNLEGFRPGKCDLCDRRIPEFVDIKLGEPEARQVPEQGALDERIAELEKAGREERWAFWRDQFEKCIRCHACREHCPMCYCERCIADKTRPDWIESSPHLRGNLSWNLIRAFHLAGRCIMCGQCEDACPAGIPLLLLNRKLASSVESHYGYKAGQSLTGKPPLAEFAEEDSEDFIL